MGQAQDRRDNDQWELDNASATTLVAENFRGASAASGSRPERGEERISTFWRVFGGTLLSIGALVCITIIQQFSNSLGELRTAVAHLTESRGDLVKSEDVNTRMAALWNSIKELQGINGAMLALKERSALLEQQLKTSQDQLNSRLVVVGTTQKDLDAMHSALSAARERAALLEQQVKASEEERKEQIHEFQRLRERLAVLEGRQGAVIVPTSNRRENK